MTGQEYERYSILAEIAELYYLKGQQQAEIAKKMNISRSLVSKMISEAQQKGIVSIAINRFFRRAAEVESALSDRFGIETAVLSLPGSLTPVEIKRQLGRLAADIIYELLEPSSKIGFTFGTSLKETVESLALKPVRQITAVQLTGSLGASESAFDSHELVHKLSSSWNCDAVFLHAPFIVNSTEIKKHLFNSRSNRHNAEICNELDVAVVGMSSLSSRGGSALYKGGHISAMELQMLKAHGVTGDIGSYSIDREGRLVEVEALTRMIAIDEQGWKTIRSRVGIAFGEQKTDIIRAALKGGWLTSLITDEATAKLL